MSSYQPHGHVRANQCRRHQGVLHSVAQQKEPDRFRLLFLLARDPPPRHGPFGPHLGWLSLSGGQKFGDYDFESLRKGMQHGQRWVCAPRFDTAHIGPKDTTSVGQLFLRQLLQRAQFFDP